MSGKGWIFAAAALLAGSPGIAQQLGGSVQAPVPEGLTEGTGAPFPKGHYAELDALPDWGGVWFVTSGGSAREGTSPPHLTAEYQARRDKWLAEVQANNGVEKRTRSNCSPPGMPRIMRLGQYPYEFIVSPGRVTIHQEAWMQTRTIWTDGRAHEEDPDPTFMGDSIGRWDGNALLVDTIGISDQLDLDTGVAHSDKFHLTERIYLDPADPDVLINEMHMEDPAALAEPFEVTVKYRRDRYGKLLEFQCSDNDRNPVNENGDTEYN
jgi:hypothetical protein